MRIVLRSGYALYYYALQAGPQIHDGVTYKEILDFSDSAGQPATQGRIAISTYFIGAFPSGVKRFSPRVHKGTRRFKLILFSSFFGVVIIYVRRLLMFIGSQPQPSPGGHIVLGGRLRLIFCWTLPNNSSIKGRNSGRPAVGYCRLHDMGTSAVSASFPHSEQCVNGGCPVMCAGAWVKPYRKSTRHRVGSGWDTGLWWVQ